ncbi:MAB_1171c family putative transporter [Amycolatopsis lexingtonensis]|uniref:MAB_1171c family putative transporter n=1 Tax=Amycolatopsis lexingtonensis TaxID=218822 RepID=UPI003F72A832
MNLPNLAMWGAAAGASGWKVSQLARVPVDRGLRVITACTFLVFLALTAQLAADPGSALPTASGQLPKLFQNVVLTFFFALLIVLLESIVDSGDVATRGLIELAIAVVASCGLAATFVLADKTSGSFSYEAAGSAANQLLFYLIGNVYMAYATARGAALTWRAGNQTQSRVRLSLRVAGAGLVVCCLGTHLPRIASTAGRLVLRQDVVPGTGFWTTPFLALGISIFFFGIAYPGVRAGIVKLRLWFLDRRRYRQLRPLWAALCETFPNITLLPTTSQGREAFRVRHMRLHFYRRAIECRDGLVCLSPYLEPDEPTDGATTLSAERLREGLLRSTQGEPRTGVHVVARPARPGMDADLQELLALSHGLLRADALNGTARTEGDPRPTTRVPRGRRRSIS